VNDNCSVYDAGDVVSRKIGVTGRASWTGCGAVPRFHSISRQSDAAGLYRPTNPSFAPQLSHLETLETLKGFNYWLCP
jgi:hypothetical protein